MVWLEDQVAGSEPVPRNLVGRGCWGGGQSQSHMRDPSKYSGILCHSSGSKQTIKRALDLWGHGKSPPLLADSLHKVTRFPDSSCKDSAFKRKWQTHHPGEEKYLKQG